MLSENTISAAVAALNADLALGHSFAAAVEVNATDFGVPPTILRARAARETAVALFTTYAIETDTDNLTPGDLVKLYNALADGDEGDQELAEWLLSKRPGIVNYDERGNWIGSVSNENGWTA